MAPVWSRGFFERSLRPGRTLNYKKMVAIAHIPPRLHELYEIREWRHASAILLNDFPNEWNDICAVLEAFRLRKSRFVVPGGRKSLISAEIDEALTKLGWVEKQFDTEIRVDQNVLKSPTHKVDCFKHQVGLEIEWNNKDPFFDRDLNNFRLLFELRALSVGVIITRCDELQGIFDDLGKGRSYGNSTTHLSKLLPRLDGGGGGGCPILVFGMRTALYLDDVPDAEITMLVSEFNAAKESKWKTFGPTLSRYIPATVLRKAPPTEEEE